MAFDWLNTLLNLGGTAAAASGSGGSTGGLLASLGSIFGEASPQGNRPGLGLALSGLGQLASKFQATPNEGATEEDVKKANRYNMIAGILGGLGQIAGGEIARQSQSEAKGELAKILSGAGTTTGQPISTKLAEFGKQYPDFYSDDLLKLQLDAGQKEAAAKVAAETNTARKQQKAVTLLSGLLQSPNFEQVPPELYRRLEAESGYGGTGVLGDIEGTIATARQRNKQEAAQKAEMFGLKKENLTAQTGHLKNKEETARETLELSKKRLEFLKSQGASNEAIAKAKQALGENQLNLEIAKLNLQQNTSATPNMAVNAEQRQNIKTRIDVLNNEYNNLNAEAKTLQESQLELTPKQATRLESLFTQMDEIQSQQSDLKSQLKGIYPKTATPIGEQPFQLPTSAALNQGYQQQFEDVLGIIDPKDRADVMARVAEAFKTPAADMTTQTSSAIPTPNQQSIQAAFGAAPSPTATPTATPSPIPTASPAERASMASERVRGAAQIKQNEKKQGYFDKYQSEVAPYTKRPVQANQSLNQALKDLTATTDRDGNKLTPNQLYFRQLVGLKSFIQGIDNSVVYPKELEGVIKDLKSRFGERYGILSSWLGRNQPLTQKELLAVTSSIRDRIDQNNAFLDMISMGGEAYANDRAAGKFGAPTKYFEVVEPLQKRTGSSAILSQIDKALQGGKAVTSMEYVD